MVFIANKETGQIHQLRRETPFSFPVIEKDNQGNDIYEDSYEDPEHRRLPKYVRTADGEIKFETRTIQELIEQKRNQNRKKRKKLKRPKKKFLKNQRKKPTTNPLPKKNSNKKPAFL